MPEATGFLIIVAVVAAAVLQIAMVVTIFIMNSKLANIAYHLRLMAYKGDVLWACPKCRTDNVYWIGKCVKCGLSK